MSAIALRAVGFIVLLSIAGCLGLYVVTGDRRWLVWARRLFVAVLAVALVIAAFLILERLIIAI